MKKIGIIGSGIGGLSAAIYLASKGFDVTIFEKNSKIGGKIAEHRHEKYRFDLGPTILTMPFVIEHLFEFAGFNLYEMIEIERIETISRNFFQNGNIINIYDNPDKTEEELRTNKNYDKNKYHEYITYTKELYEKAADIFLFEPIHELYKLFKEKKIPPPFRFLMIDAFKSMSNRNKEYFRNGNILQIFNRYATYNGSSPYLAPATLNMISYVEQVIGTYNVKNGMYRIIDAIQLILNKLDVEVKTEEEVVSIINNKSEVSGIMTNKNKYDFDYVVCNADYSYSSDKLLINRKFKKISDKDISLSGILILWGINKRIDQLAKHNVFFSKNYQNEFNNIFKDHIIPDDPTIYISKSDENEHGESWYILINSPYFHENMKIDYSAIRLNILNILAKHNINIEDSIKYEKIFTPYDIMMNTNSYKGSIYGMASNSMKSAFKRPANRSRKIKRLYFAGGSVHPGGGVPLSVLSGRHCAELICYKEGIDFEK